MAADGIFADPQLLRYFRIREPLYVLHTKDLPGHGGQSVDGLVDDLPQLFILKGVMCFRFGWDIILLQLILRPHFVPVIIGPVPDRLKEIGVQGSGDALKSPEVPQVDKEVLYKVPGDVFLMEDGQRQHKEPVPGVQVQVFKSLEIIPPETFEQHHIIRILVRHRS